MINENREYPVHPGHHVVCWSAIVIGALIAIGLSFLLNLFLTAIGLSSFSFNSNEGATAMAVGGLIAALIGGIATMFVSGYAAGYLARNNCPGYHHGALYGFATWSLALVLSAALASHVSSYVAHYSNNMNSNVSVSNSNSNSVNTSGGNTNSAGDNQVQVATNPQTLAWTAFIIFVLFFVGAISTCVGACWALGCRRHEHMHERV